MANSQRRIHLAILVAALGYFVDVYDLVLFSVVRVESLKALGLSGAELTSQGVHLINSQMIGMLLGGLVWGILGDKFGRIRVLFGSILLYSGANILNAFVSDVFGYSLCRFAAGLGLAGEIGAGITLVSELMPKEKRGYATTLVATVGVSGAVVAGLFAELVTWRTSYIIGGVMGLMLLLLRVSVAESGLFAATQTRADIARGDLRLLLGDRARALRYVHCVLSGVPIWFVVGILCTFGPELGQSMGISEPVKVSQAVFYCYIGFTIGDLTSGLFSQILASRLRVMRIYLILLCLSSLLLLQGKGLSVQAFYYSLIFIGACGGYWAVFVTNAAEQFGTNLRATVATSVPNFVRGMVVPMTLGFDYLKSQLGAPSSASIVCTIVGLVALFSLSQLRETFAVDLDYHEES